MGGLRLRGTEVWTVELTGTIDAPLVAAAFPEVELIERDGEVEVGLLVFAMRGLAMRGVPGPGFSYREALWRVAAAVDGAPGWLAHTCDLDRGLVRVFGRRLIRYPARTATIELDEADASWRLQVRATETLRVSLQLEDDTPAPSPPRPVLVIDRGRAFTVPWAEDPAPFRRRATASVSEDRLSTATLGAEVRWQPAALVHRGRTHHCGFASAVP